MILFFANTLQYVKYVVVLFENLSFKYIKNNGINMSKFYMYPKLLEIVVKKRINWFNLS